MAVLYNMAMLHYQGRPVNKPVSNSGFGQPDILPESTDYVAVREYSVLPLAKSP